MGWGVGSGVGWMLGGRVGSWVVWVGRWVVFSFLVSRLLVF